jgi:hypothetical protein
MLVLTTPTATAPLSRTRTRIACRLAATDHNLAKRPIYELDANRELAGLMRIVP